MAKIQVALGSEHMLVSFLTGNGVSLSFQTVRQDTHHTKSATALLFIRKKSPGVILGCTCLVSCGCAPAADGLVEVVPLLQMD